MLRCNSSGETLKKLNQVRPLGSEEGKDRTFSIDKEHHSFVLSDVLLKGVSTVCSVIKYLALICCSHGTSCSLNLGWYAAFQNTLCYFWTKQDCTLQMFLIKLSPPKTPNDHWGRGHKPRFSSRMTQTLPAKSPRVCTTRTKHTSLQFTKWNTKRWYSASWGGFLLQSQVPLPSWNSHHTANNETCQAKKV